MSDEKNCSEADQTGKDAINVVKPPVFESELTPHKAGKPIALGFVLGAVYFFYALASGTLAEIDVAQLLIQLTGLVGICLLASMGFRGWMKGRWSNQHRFEKMCIRDRDSPACL